MSTTGLSYLSIFNSFSIYFDKVIKDYRSCSTKKWFTLFSKIFRKSATSATNVICGTICLDL